MIQALVVLANKITAAAVAWVKKYLVVASTARGLWSCDISGRMARVFSSRPIQAMSQCELANVTAVPRARVEMSTARTYGFTSIDRGQTYILGVWARKLF